MTRLSDAALGDLARRNDLTGTDVITAIAAAVATSVGDPAYHHVSGPGPSVDYRGLWGLDAARYPALAGFDLFHPEVAAKIMADLVRRTDGWQWCPAFRANAHLRYMERATPAASMLPGPQRHDPDIAADRFTPDLARLYDRAAARSAPPFIRLPERFLP